MKGVEPYPPTVLPVGGRVGRTGFFPGGSGLWGAERDRPLPPMPVGGVMLLGHNLDSEDTFRKALEADGENLKSATWRELITMLPASGVALERCFFTNFFIGLIPGRNSTGEFPGGQDLAFVARCRAFLVEQLRVVKPRLVIVMGLHTPSLLAPIAPELGRWETVRTLKDLDSTDSALVRNVHVPGLEALFDAVVITHPSYAALNRRHRALGELTGDQAEAELLREALNAVRN